jgi:uncharacterized protein (TIGR02996 family)
VAGGQGDGKCLLPESAPPSSAPIDPNEADMDEQGFLKLLDEKPDDSDLLLAYADWLEEQGREDDALATRLRRVVKGAVEAFTRARAETAEGYNGRVARKWFAMYPGLRVMLVAYLTVTKLGLNYMPPGTRGQRRATTPRAADPTSVVLYHRKGKGYNTNFVAFIRWP